MDHQQIGAALLQGEPATDVYALARHALRQDRRRVWIAAIACVIAWMLVVMSPWATVLPMVAKVADTMRQSSVAGRAPANPAELADVIHWATMATFFSSIASMLFAAICTVALVLLSRRATLRQVNARLSEISDQLKLMASRS